jgi:hypothetical protein
MRQTTRGNKRTETRTLLAAPLTCYLLGFACVFALSYSLAALTAPGLADNVRLTLELEPRPWSVAGSRAALA